MTWFKVDDGFWSHPKTATLSDSAVTLWVRAGSYCCQHLTDGFVKQAALRLIGEPAASAELVDAELWHVVDGGWVFHDWDEYQETSETVKRRRDDARERQRRSRELREEKKRQSQRESRVTDDVTDSVSNGVSSQPPTRPDPTKVTTDVVTSGDASDKPKRAKPRTRISDDYMPPADVVEAIRDEIHGITDEQLRYQHRKFIDHWKKTGKPMADWDATWRNWMRTANERGELGSRNSSQGGQVHKLRAITQLAADVRAQEQAELVNTQRRAVE